MTLQIRTATESDVQAILDIKNYEIINSTAIYDYEPRTLEMQKEWFYKKKEEQMPVIVATAGHKILGFATYGIFRPKIAYRFSVEHSIYLSPEARGKGVGTLLLRELIQTAKNNGCHNMIAGLDASNAVSYAFHKKMGFVEVARFKEVGFKFDKWLDLIFMQLML